MEEMINNIYIHSIGEVDEIITYDRLVSILKLGNIYSRKKLDELGISHSGPNSYGLNINEDNKNMYYSEDIHYDVISLHDPLNRFIRKAIIKNIEFSHFRPSRIALMISKEIPVLPREETKGIDIGEVQVRDSISTEYIMGIIIPNNEIISAEIKELLCNKIKYICEENNTLLPIYDYQRNLLYKPETKKTR